MDSPVMLDTASKFRRGIDLDCEFPGFNFDDDGFGRRGDFRSHLDDLASRHPEFADHFVGSSWGDIPFHGSLRNRRRGSGSGNNYQSHQDEDTKSQASGSSAASGASAVSSHGDPEITRQDFQEPKRNPIPQYGLRNTVDIGQHQNNMDNPQKVNRNQRSMSAPPENRQDSQQQTEQPRFVSRVEITPQQQKQEQLQREKSPEPLSQQTQQEKTQQQGNVRHIPIFVEGRDEPVISRKRDDTTFSGHPSSPPQNKQAPPQFQPPPNFQRPSHYNERFARQNWPPMFQEAFFDQPRWSRDEPDRHFPRDEPDRHFTRDEPDRHFTRDEPDHHFTRDRLHQQPKQHPAQQPQYQQKQHPQQYQQSHPQYQQNHSQYQQPQHEKNQHQQYQQPPQQKQEPEAPKPKPPLPKDPLERVALVQKEVDSLTEQVRNYTGDSRKDKEYIYLDEMLTRELIKLDDIETEGKDNVRLARKTAIKTIQESINLLESKVPLPGQEEQTKSQIDEDQSNPQTETEQPEEALNDKPIPLPPGPNSLAPPKEGSAEKSQEIAETQVAPGQVESLAKTPLETVKTDEAKVEEPSQNQQLSEPENALITNVQPENNIKSQTQDSKSQEVLETTKAAKSPKKMKKTKKQPTPVSEEPIPLPEPKSSDKETK